MTTSDKLLPVHKRFDVTFSHGQGVYLYDNQGKKYLDFGAGIAVNCLGHCHPKLVEALTSQARKLWHVSNIYNGNELNNYAEKLVSHSFADYVFFCNSGAEAVECAIKMIRRHFYVKGETEKYRIITFKGAFHGRTIATISAAGKEKYLEGFKPELDGFDHVEFGNIEEVKNAITKHTAGILIEPIQGEEGIRVADKNFMKELRELCDTHNLLLAFDEVQCGMGRTGHLHAYEYFKVRPDIISLAKAIGGGYPLGACLATKDAAQGMTAGVHGTTYGGNPLAMSVANAVLDEMLKPDFFPNIHKISQELRNNLEQLKKNYPNLIDEIRGVGLMIGMKINSQFEHVKLVEKFMENGLLTVPASDNVIRIIPPLIITSEHVDEAKEKLALSLSQLSN